MPKIKDLSSTAFPTLAHMFAATNGTDTVKLTVSQVRELMDFAASEISATTGGDVQTALTSLSTNKADKSYVDSQDNAIDTKATKALLATRGHISGLILSNNVSDAVNDLDWAAGICASTETTPVMMVHPAGTTQLDVAFGTGNGGRFDSAISDGTWHCYVIADAAGNVSRGLSKSLNPTSQPNYPSAYVHYRRVGSILRTSGTIVAFSQDGDEFLRSVPAADLSLIPSDTLGHLVALSVPTGIKLIALMRGRINNTTTLVASDILISSPDESDRAPNAIDGDMTVQQQVSGVPVPWFVNVRVNASGQVRYRSGNTTTGIAIATYGWIDNRDRFV